MDFEYYQTKIKQVSTFPIDSAWGQGRSAFGGLTAALVLTHIEEQTGLTDRDLRTINIHFCGAVILNEPCEFTHRVLSEGKSVFQDEFMDIGVMYFTNMMNLRSNKTSSVDRD